MARKKEKVEPPVNGGYPAPPKDWAPRSADGKPPRPEVIEAITRAWETAVGLPRLDSVAHAVAPDCTVLEYDRAARVLNGRYDSLTTFGLNIVKAEREAYIAQIRNNKRRVMRKGETFS
jgi:hypothetical protein